MSTVQPTPEWKDRGYGIHRLELPLVTILCTWEDYEGFRVQVVGEGGAVTAKERPQNLEDAQRLGLRLAQKYLTEALTTVNNLIDAQPGHPRPPVIYEG